MDLTSVLTALAFVGGMAAHCAAAEVKQDAVEPGLTATETSCEYAANR